MNCVSVVVSDFQRLQLSEFEWGRRSSTAAVLSLRFTRTDTSELRTGLVRLVTDFYVSSNTLHFYKTGCIFVVRFQGHKIQKPLKLENQAE